MHILGKQVVLRAIEIEDLPFLQRWSNDPEVSYLVGGWHFPSSSWHQNRWFESIQKDSLNQRFAIDSRDRGLIGMANLVEINWKDRNAFHGMYLGDRETRGKGYGTDTVMAIMRHGFEELGLHRLDTSIIEYNEASLKLYTGKCGWRVEGRQREWYWRKNRFWDKVMVGVTRDEYFALVKETAYWDRAH